MPHATLTIQARELRKRDERRQHVGMTAADPLARLRAAKGRFERLRAQLPEREARRNSLLTDAHADPLSEQEKQQREARRARGEKNPPVPGRGRRAAIARLVGQTERNVRNLHEAELSRREVAGLPRRMTEPDTAFTMLTEAQQAVDEITEARDRYYEAITDALPPPHDGARPSGPDAHRFAAVRTVTGLDSSHLRRIQRTVLEKPATPER